MTTALVLALALSKAPLDSVKLSLPAGTKLTYSGSAKVVADAMGQTFNSTTTTKSVYEVTGIEDGWMRIKQTTTEYKLDSDSPFAGNIPDVKGMAVSSLVSPARKQKDWKLVERGGLTQEQADMMSQGAVGEVESGLDGLVFPDGDLAVGTKWEYEHAPSGMGMSAMRAQTKGKIKTAYEVLDVKDGVATVTARTTGNFTMDISTPDGGSFTLQAKVDETQKFTVRTKDGVVTKVESAGTQTMTSDFGEFTSTTTGKIELVRA